MWGHLWSHCHWACSESRYLHRTYSLPAAYPLCMQLPGQGRVLERAFEHIFSFDFKCWVSLLFSILDPPPPDESPNITSVSHNSVKVKFSGFDASHGPIKAYAVILTTAEGKEGPTWVNLCDRTILVTFLLL